MKRLLNEITAESFGDLFSIAGISTQNAAFSAEGLNRRVILTDAALTASTELCGEVYVRRDKIENTSASGITLCRAMSKFVLPDGAYEVYTQYNNWCGESRGGWQPLVTGVTSRVDSVRTTVGAAPILALWNEQNGRGVVFHFSAVSSWEMSAIRRDLGAGRNRVEVTIGPSADEFALTVAPGEAEELATVLYYSFRSKTDLDCYKLHRYLNEKAPRRSMPVLYNTWLSEFDSFTYDSLLRQAGLASKIGCEYFIVDAGWFGESGKWWNLVGDWQEERVGAFAGRMEDFSQEIHQLGMKFGLWFEIERAAAGATLAKRYPQYYIPAGDQSFVNFASEAACEFILSLLDDRISHYHIDFIKFDFNADFFCALETNAFISYFKGYAKFIAELRRRHPGLYLENCASGGMRMQLANQFLFDSFWLSDDQCCFEGVRIFRDTLKRLSPQSIEKWAVVQSLTDFRPVYGGGTGEKLLSTRDAVVENVGSVSDSWLCGFLSASPLGLSCNLEKLSPRVLEVLRNHIAKFKSERGFYLSSECRIIADSDTATVFEFSDRTLTKIRLLAFVRDSKQAYLTLYPAVDLSCAYAVNGERMNGAELDAYGLRIDTSTSWQCVEVTIEKK